MTYDFFEQDEFDTFKHAQNPHTETFREFPDYVKQNLDPDKHKK